MSKYNFSMIKAWVPIQNLKISWVGKHEKGSGEQMWDFDTMVVTEKIFVFILIIAIIKFIEFDKFLSKYIISSIRNNFKSLKEIQMKNTGNKLCRHESKIK